MPTFTAHGEVCRMPAGITRLATPRGRAASAVPMATVVKLVGGCENGDVTVWEAETVSPGAAASPGLAVRHRFTAHSDAVRDIAVSDDGATAVSASEDGTARVWDLKSGTETRALRSRGGAMGAVSIVHDGRVVTASSDQMLQAWSTQNDTETGFDRHDLAAGNVVLRASPMSTNFVFTAAGPSCGIWTLTESGDFQNHAIFSDGDADITAVEISPDGSLGVTVDGSGTFTLYDLNERKMLYSYDFFVSGLRDVNFSPTRYWLCGTLDENVTILDLETKEFVAELAHNLGGDVKATTSAWSQDGVQLYVGLSNGSVHLFSVAS